MIFLYTFKKAFSASLLLLLNASICEKDAKKKKLIICYICTLKKQGDLFHCKASLHAYLSILTMRWYVQCSRGCLDSGCVGVFFPVESVQLFS